MGSSDVTVGFEVTVTNPNSVAATGVGFTLVSGIASAKFSVLSSTNAASCTGTFTTAGALSGGAVPANDRCKFSGTVTVPANTDSATSVTLISFNGGANTRVAGQTVSVKSAVGSINLPTSLVEAQDLTSSVQFTSGVTNGKIIVGTSAVSVGFYIDAY